MLHDSQILMGYVNMLSIEQVESIGLLLDEDKFIFALSLVETVCLCTGFV